MPLELIALINQFAFHGVVHDILCVLLFFRASAISKKLNLFFQCIYIVFFSFKIEYSNSPRIYSSLLLKMLLSLLMNYCFGHIKNFFVTIHLLILE